jgi:hypothetical protein
VNNFVPLICFNPNFGQTLNKAVCAPYPYIRKSYIRSKNNKCT